MHLQLAEAMRLRVRNRPRMVGRQLLLDGANLPAFYLGSVAPDYQTICGMARARTHFYKMPPHALWQGPRAMLAAHPYLVPGAELESRQAAFVAAYLVHLYLDLKWYFEVVDPYFARSDQFAAREQAYLAHVSLLTYLDHLALASLPRDASGILAKARVAEALPVEDQDALVQWQAYLVQQLRPGMATQTVAIFAGRLQMTPQAFAAKLEDRDWMNDELFSKVPVSDIQRLLEESVTDCLDLVAAYWSGRPI
jgi:hypothetical protein